MKGKAEKIAREEVWLTTYTSILVGPMYTYMNNWFKLNYYFRVGKNYVWRRRPINILGRY